MQGKGISTGNLPVFLRQRQKPAILGHDKPYRILKNRQIADYCLLKFMSSVTSDINSQQSELPGVVRPLGRFAQALGMWCRQKPISVTDVLQPALANDY